jgi:hypothetical protein
MQIIKYFRYFSLILKILSRRKRSEGLLNPLTGCFRKGTCLAGVVFGKYLSRKTAKVFRTVDDTVIKRVQRVHAASLISLDLGRLIKSRPQPAGILHPNWAKKLN